MPRRGENIFKRKDGRWEARYIKTVNLDGTKKYGSVYGRSYTEVKNKQSKMISNPREKNCYYKENSTLNSLINEWLITIKNQVKISTIQKYESLIENHIKYSIGHIQLKFITASVIDQFTDEQLHSGHNGGGSLSRKTVNDILIILGLVFSFSFERYGISMPKIKLLREKKKEMRVMTVYEQKKLILYLFSNMDIYKFGVLFALYTGVRIGELCALQWEDISFDNISINKTMQRLKSDNGRTKIYINSPKSESSIRMIPIPTFLKPIIAKFRREQGYVLQTDTKEYIEPRLMQIKFSKMITEAKIEKVNFHGLRHTFATRCIESGFDIKSLSEVLGHSDVKTTLNRYVHSSFEFKKANMEKLSFMISGLT